MQHTVVFRELLPPRPTMNEGRLSRTTIWQESHFFVAGEALEVAWQEQAPPGDA